MKTVKPKVAHRSPTFIKVSEADGVISGVEAGFEVWIAEREQHEKYFSFFIPAFDIHFVADTEDAGRKMVDVAVDGFFEYWIKDRSIYEFFNKIEKLGFEKQVKKEPKISVRRKINKFSLIHPSIPLLRGHFELGKKSYKLAS